MKKAKKKSPAKPCDFNPEWGMNYYARISAALKDLGYAHPVEGITMTGDALKMIALALEDIASKARTDGRP